MAETEIRLAGLRINPATNPASRTSYSNSHSILKVGGTARLVVLQHKSHGYAARESFMHMLWETDQWLEKWVKQKPKQQVVLK